MKYIHFILGIISCVYSFSADPNLFGSKNRRIGKQRLANEFKDMAGETALDIKELRSRDPFQSAGAKSAMAKTTMGAKQMEKRMLNVLGAGASPEALISAQGATSQAVGSAAGEIATGAEANKNAELARLRGEKQNQMGTYAGIKASSEDERGSGWNTLFEGIGVLGNLATGVGGGIGAIKNAKN